jgi:hypothetical protein
LRTTLTSSSKTTWKTSGLLQSQATNIPQDRWQLLMPPMSRKQGYSNPRESGASWSLLLTRSGSIVSIRSWWPTPRTLMAL